MKQTPNSAHGWRRETTNIDSSLPLHSYKAESGLLMDDFSALQPNNIISKATYQPISA